MKLDQALVKNVKVTNKANHVNSPCCTEMPSEIMFVSNHKIHNVSAGVSTSSGAVSVASGAVVAAAGACCVAKTQPKSQLSFVKLTRNESTNKWGT